MDIKQLNSFLNNSGVHLFFPYNKPLNVNYVSICDITGGTSERGGVNKKYFQIITIERHPELAINKAKEIKEYLYKNIKGAFFNGKKVINIEANTPEPLFLGEENGVFSVSWNYTIIEG